MPLQTSPTDIESYPTWICALLQWQATHKKSGEIKWTSKLGIATMKRTAKIYSARRKLVRKNMAVHVIMAGFLVWKVRASAEV